MKLTKFFFVLSFFLSLATSSGQVTVQISNLKVGGVAVTNNTVNFNGSSSLSISLDVNLSTFNGDSNNTFGNTYIFFKASGSETETQVGFATNTFVVTYPPFVSQTTYTSTRSFGSITLNASNFFASGGVLYAKYINNNNSNYTSSNISVIGGTRTTPSPQSNTICCNQTIRYGDKPGTITGSNIVMNGQVGLEWIVSSGSPLSHDDLRGSTALKPDYLFQTTTYKRKVTYYSSPQSVSISSPVTITVVPTPIMSNTIYTNAITMGDDSYEIREGSPVQFNGLGTYVNLNILADPFHVADRSDALVNVEDFQWQYKSGDSGAYWNDIPNAVLPYLDGFTMPSDNLSGSYYIRRIAKYQGISKVSNVLKIVTVKASDSNTVCCSQLLEAVASAGFQSPSVITGSTPVYSVNDGGYYASPSSVSFSYQWQQQSRTSAWSDISGATSMDFLPPAISTFSTIINYRRVVKVSYWKGFSHRSYVTYSNGVSVATPPGGVRSKVGVEDKGGIDLDCAIYPNPTSSVLNISGISDVLNINIRMVNSLGQEIKMNFVNKDKNLISADVSDLQNGVYYMIFEKGSNVVLKKFIKN
ncbi:hypothetical protein FLJC2902T_14480 [Flavobacterium limnosediminis JC2902]|uniref:Secretion system C-terminal sorting domain-containing protein n=1 Tax=Flavobacterium limnosediminis JC2902 TaxID=1341181 RepID=V6SQE0_9FLAO|nr:T9SS type A sorting domain-containing protein [Flavobacterium limnosediminis]ESU28851.1 hypothetical protein FLJC2902T_14480 [Flavobacterium limnosediminis JC2902]